MNPRGYTGSAAALVGLGRTDDAIAILRQGLELLPDNAEILAELERLGASADGANSDEAGGQSAGQDGATNDATTDAADSESAGQAGQGDGQASEPVNFMPSHIAEIISQISAAVRADDLEAVYALATNPQLVAFTEEAEVGVIVLGHVVISRPLNMDDSGLAPMTRVVYYNLDENGNGTVFSNSTTWESGGRSGHGFNRRSVEGYVANGRVIETSFVSLPSHSVHNWEGFYVNGYREGYFISRAYRDDVITLMTGSTYSGGRQIAFSFVTPEYVHHQSITSDSEPQRREFYHWRVLRDRQWGIAD